MSRRWLEYGRTMGAPEWRLVWVRVGPLVAEAHSSSFRLGLTAGPWYFGLLLGPFVLTLGRRRYSIRMAARSWTITTSGAKGPGSVA